MKEETLGVNTRVDDCMLRGVNFREQMRRFPGPQRPKATAGTVEHCPKARALSAGDGAIASAGLASGYKYDESLASGFRHTAFLTVLRCSVEVSV